MEITDLRKTEILHFLMTDMFDEISMPKKFCGRSHWSLVQMVKSCSDALEAGEAGNLLTFQQKQNFREGSHILKHFI